jgi:hypothetical protein
MELMLKQQYILGIEYNRQKKERKYLKQKAEKERAKKVRDEIKSKSGKTI